MTESREQTDYMHAATELLLKLGFQAGSRGYRCLRDAVVEECKGKGYTESVTKLLYPMLAHQYGITDKQVERAIRCAVETAWKQKNDEAWEDFWKELGHVSEERPTNKKIIITLANMIKRSVADEGSHQYRSTCI